MVQQPVKQCRATLGYYLVRSCNQPEQHRCEECGLPFCAEHLTGLRCSRCSLTGSRIPADAPLTTEDLEWFAELGKIIEREQR
jgi:ribosomal protein S27AE